MYFDIKPTTLNRFRKKKFKCLIHDRTGKVVRSRNFKDIYAAHEWGYRKVNNTRV